MFESCEELTARLTATGYFIDPVMIKGMRMTNVCV
jgi:hypothetical protein